MGIRKFLKVLVCVKYARTFFEGLIDVSGARGFTLNELLNQQACEKIYTTKVFIKAIAVLLRSEFSVNSPSCDINSPFNKLFLDRQLQFDPNMTLSSYFLLASGKQSFSISLLPEFERLFPNSEN